MSDYGQRSEMEHASMHGTLAAQASMIWPLERPVLEALGLGRAEHVVDLGCGTGEIASRVARTWPDLRVTGIDLFPGHLAEARRRHGDLPGLELVEGDARATGLEDGMAGAVLVRHLLHALPDAPRVLAEARRLLRPGGLLWVLAEDYAGILVDTPDEAARRLFVEAAPAVLPTGTDLLHGRKAPRQVRAAGFEDVVVRPIVVDTDNADRAAWAAMLGHWRDGYASFLARGLGVEPAAVARRFDAMIAAVKDPARWSAWLLVGVAARVSAASPPPRPS